MTRQQLQRSKGTDPGSTRSSSPGWNRLYTVDIELRPAWKSWVLFLIVTAIVTFLGFRAYRTVMVSLLGDSTDVGPLRRAMAMDPSDPELHHRLGMVLYDSPSEQDRIEGLKQLHLSTELNPFDARYWADLAWVCEFAGDIPCATHGVQEAVRLNPMTPQIRWVAANTYLRAGQSDEAMAEFRHLLEMDPSYAPATFHLCLGSLGNPQMILDKVVPPSRKQTLKLVYLNILSRSEMDGADELASRVWAKTVAQGTRFPLSSATAYIEHLIQFGRVEEAEGAWQDLMKLGIVPKADNDAGGNLVYNGDFEHMPLNAGFDWRNPPAPYLALDFSDPGGHTGKSCLRIDFTVSRNEAYQPLFQIIPVDPNKEYTLSSFVRSKDITSDSGPRFQVLDPIHTNGPNVMADSTVGTTPWHQITTDFCTGPDTKAVQLSLLRLRGRTYPTEITGSFWLDTVSIKATGAGEATGCKASPNRGP